MRSYAASRGAILRKLRLPAARPYLFTGFRIAGPAAVVGAIVGELPSLIQDGLARQIITGMQYYSLNAEYLWATIVISSLLGIGVYLLVAAVEGVRPSPRATIRTERPHDGRAGAGRRWRPHGRRDLGRVQGLRCPGPGRRTGRGPGRYRPVGHGRRIRLADRPVRLRQVHAPADRRRPHRADVRDA